MIFSIASYDYLATELAGVMEMDRGEIERDEFPDGEHYLRVVSDVVDRDLVLVGGTISDRDTLELYDLACALVENGAATLQLVVPWFGYATMDRAVRTGEAVLAKTRARLLSSIPPTRRNEVLLLDIHSEGIPHYFEGSIHPMHVYGNAVIEPLARELTGGTFVLGSTDAGRAKWVESLARDLRVPAAFVYKKRTSAESTEVRAVSTRLHGETVVIYDDMIRTGTSLMNAARAYRDAGAGELFAIATHGVFPGDSFQRIRESGLFAAVATTNSHPRALQLVRDGLVVRSCAALFAPHIVRRG
jgi:ribose-phosphate pyrophosphokinase